MSSVEIKVFLLGMGLFRASLYASVSVLQVETFANKRKSPRLKEGYNTWCGLLCDYRTQITEELKEKLATAPTMEERFAILRQIEELNRKQK